MIMVRIILSGPHNLIKGVIHSIFCSTHANAHVRKDWCLERIFSKGQIRRGILWTFLLLALIAAGFLSVFARTTFHTTTIPCEQVTTIFKVGSNITRKTVETRGLWDDVTLDRVRRDYTDALCETMDPPCDRTTQSEWLFSSMLGTSRLAQPSQVPKSEYSFWEYEVDEIILQTPGYIGSLRIDEPFGELIYHNASFDQPNQSKPQRPWETNLPNHTKDRRTQP